MNGTTGPLDQFNVVFQCEGDSVGAVLLFHSLEAHELTGDAVVFCGFDSKLDTGVFAGFGCFGHTGADGVEVDIGHAAD